LSPQARAFVELIQPDLLEQQHRGHSQR